MATNGGFDDDELICLMYSSQCVHDIDCRFAKECEHDESSLESGEIPPSPEREDTDLVEMRELALQSISETSFNQQLVVVAEETKNGEDDYDEHNLESIRQQVLASMKLQVEKRPLESRLDRKDWKKKRVLEEGECSDESVDESDGPEVDEPAKIDLIILDSSASTTTTTNLYNDRSSAYSLRKIAISPQMFSSLSVQVDVSDADDETSESGDFSEEKNEPEPNDGQNRVYCGKTNEQLRIEELIKEKEDDINDIMTIIELAGKTLKANEKALEERRVLVNNSTSHLTNLREMVENLQRQIIVEEEKLVDYGSNIKTLEIACTDNRKSIEKHTGKSVEKNDELCILKEQLLACQKNRIPSYSSEPDDWKWQEIKEEADRVVGSIEQVSPFEKSTAFVELYQNGCLEFSAGQRIMNEETRSCWLRHGYHTFERNDIWFLVLTSGNRPLLNDPDDLSPRQSNKDFGRTSIAHQNLSFPTLKFMERAEYPIPVPAIDFATVMSELESRYYEFTDSIKATETKLRQNPNDENAWLRLCQQHYSRSNQCPKAVLIVLARAVEACPDSCKIWSLYLRTLKVVDEMIIDEIIPSAITWAKKDLYILVRTLIDLDKKEMVRANADHFCRQSAQDGNYWRLLVLVASCLQPDTAANHIVSMFEPITYAIDFEKCDLVELIRLYALAFNELPNVFNLPQRELLAILDNGFLVDWSMAPKSVSHKLEAFMRVKHRPSSLLIQNYILMMNGQNINRNFVKEDDLSQLYARAAFNDMSELELLSLRQIYLLTSIVCSISNDCPSELNEHVDERLKRFASADQEPTDFSLEYSFGLLAKNIIEKKNLDTVPTHIHVDALPYYRYEIAKAGYSQFPFSIPLFPVYISVTPDLSSILSSIQSNERTISDSRLETIFSLLRRRMFVSDLSEQSIERIYMLIRRIFSQRALCSNQLFWSIFATVTNLSRRGQEMEIEKRIAELEMKQLTDDLSNQEQIVLISLLAFLDRNGEISMLKKQTEIDRKYADELVRLWRTDNFPEVKKWIFSKLGDSQEAQYVLEAMNLCIFDRFTKNLTSVSLDELANVLDLNEFGLEKVCEKFNWKIDGQYASKTEISKKDENHEIRDVKEDAKNSKRIAELAMLIRAYMKR